VNEGVKEGGKEVVLSWARNKIAYIMTGEKQSAVEYII
jgi:hypothetical protein